MDEIYGDITLKNYSSGPGGMTLFGASVDKDRRDRHAADQAMAENVRF